MDMDLTLDEIIEKKREHNLQRSNGKKLHISHFQKKPLKWINKNNQSGQHPRPYDARNKIIQKTRAKIVDARDILNKNIRDSGIDARNMLIERKKERHFGLKSLPPQQSRRSRSPGTVISGPASGGGGGGVGSLMHKGRFGQRTITMTNRDDDLMATPWWEPKDDIGPHGGYKSKSGASHRFNRLSASVKPFVPRGYVDFDNMQQLEDQEISRTMHLSSQPLSGLGRDYADYELDMDGVEETLPPSNTLDNDPFSIYETSRNRLERPSMLPPTHVSLGNNSDKRFERHQRNLVATTNLPESLRARLFVSQPDRRVSHGIYANENGSGSSKAHMSEPASMHQRRSPPSMSLPLPLSVANNKPGYRLLVSNLHTNVTTSDIRELFNDIGPMFDARVVRPGTAEVIYKSLKHAEMAVDAYHQREFDGQPMHCVLVNPHSTNRGTQCVGFRTVNTNSSGVEVDIDALHSVLFRDR